MTPEPQLESLRRELAAARAELAQARREQAASAEVLQIISRSAFDLDGVLATLTDSARALCQGSIASISLVEGDVLRFRALSGGNPAFEAFRRAHAFPVSAPDPANNAGRVLLTGATSYIKDVAAEPGYDFGEGPRLGNFRSLIGVPLLRDGEVIGVFQIGAAEPDAVTPRQIELVETFADQAVIAIENARLFQEVRAKTRDLEESLAQQTATADVLRVISRSVSNAAPVFETILDSCQRQFAPHGAAIYLVDGDMVKGVARRGFEGGDWGADAMPLAGSSTGQAIAERRAVHVPDLAEMPGLPERFKPELRAKGGMSVLYAPMMSQDRGVGSIVVSRQPKMPFTDAEIAFVQTFADQAVIAIENARLFEDVRARTRDLQESLDQQTATADVLKIISRSVFDLDAVLAAVTESARKLCGAEQAGVHMRDGGLMRYRAGAGLSADFVAFNQQHPIDLDRSWARRTHIGLATMTGEVVMVPDVREAAEFDLERAGEIGALRAVLAAPMLRNGKVEGVFSLVRSRPEAFGPRQIEIVRTFADQAVIAIENARLFGEVQAKTRELEQSLADLRKAQDRLIQSEKLASLGQLTAGIAHEIKNPLNFVNNFAALSRELLGEMREMLEALPHSARADADELMGLIDSNLEKVAHHGRRADSIVKNMLLHSREGSRERARVNVNAMVEEALNLGYHGARAEKPGFDVAIEKSLDPQAGEAEIHLQEITRVLLNLVSNGFYAAAKRKETEGPDYRPTLTASTRALGTSVEIRIRDNGTGIPDSVRAQIFNPFFTTKPAGEGTGLGLSLSHDIVVKQHGGTIEVETEPGRFTEFVITLPREGANA